MDLAALILALIALLGLFPLAYWLWQSDRRQAARAARLDAELHRLNQAFSLITSAAVTVDRRLHALEQVETELRQRQEDLTQQGSERGFGEAIARVRQGASSAELVRDLGLSPGEADLLVMMHGRDTRGRGGRGH